MSNADLLTWLDIDEEAFMIGLQERFPDAPKNAMESIGKRLLKLQPQLRAAFHTWWTTNIIPPIGPISGYTAHDLETGAKGSIPFLPTRVFLTLDLLITDPGQAELQLSEPVHGFIPMTPGTHRVLPPRFRRVQPL